MSVFNTSLLAANFWQEFSDLFAGMGVAAGICIVLGLVLCIIEIFQPGFGIFGGLGTILILIGIIIRMLQGGTLLMLFIMIFIIVAVLLIAFVIMVRSMKYGWLSRTDFIQQGTAIDAARSEGTNNYNGLLNLTGITTTSLRLSGKAKINNTEYDVVAQGPFIDVNKKVKVVEVEGTRIVVREESNINNENK